MQITNLRKTKFAVVSVLLSLFMATLFSVGCAKIIGTPTSEMPGSSATLPAQKPEEHESESITDGVESSTAYEGWKLTEADKLLFGNYVVSDGEWIYYADNKNRELLRMRKDGSEKHRLANGGTMRRLTIIDGWVYYLTTPMIENANRGSNLCRVKIDGSQNQLLFEESYGYSLTDDEIFYTLMTTEYADGDGNGFDGIHELISQTYEMHKANLDGTGDTRLGVSGSVIDAIGGWLYYAGGGGLSRTPIKGGEIEFVSTLSPSVLSIAEYDGWLYVRGSVVDEGSRQNGIYKMRPDGSDMALFAKFTGMTVVADDYLYCATGRNELTVMSLENGEEIEKIVIDEFYTIGLFDVAGGWVFFEDSSNVYSNIWRVRLDGTGMEEL